MNYYKGYPLLLSIGWCLLLGACTADTSSQPTTPLVESVDSSLTLDSLSLVEAVEIPAPGLTPAELDSIFQLNDTTWVNLKDLHPKIELDLRYATTNNFMELQIYDCGQCYLRLATARALLIAQKELETQNLGFKMYDCYRPKSAQYKLWKKMPDRRYVAPPSKGSMHSRGGALDLTIIQLENKEELEMGTEYDYFGRAAYWVNKDLPKEVLDNRHLLRSTLEKHGFKTTSTEWWHFSYRRAWFKLSDMQWNCN